MAVSRGGGAVDESGVVRVEEVGNGCCWRKEGRGRRARRFPFTVWMRR